MSNCAYVYVCLIYFMMHLGLWTNQCYLANPLFFEDSEVYIIFKTVKIMNKKFNKKSSFYLASF